MKINKLVQTLLYLPQSIWFNFKYLPLAQAVRLPILLYKPHLLSMKGRLTIEGGVKTGMICLGFPMVSIYPNRGITWECRGNVIFKGVCRIGGDSYLAIGETGRVVFGERFGASASLKLVSYHRVSFGNDVLVGWDCLFCDTDMHALKKETGEHTRGYAPITIGANNWICNNCIVMKRAATPDYTTISAGSLVSKSYLDMPEKSVLSNVAPLEVVRTGLYRTPGEDFIEYE